jgi:hypothetical protein
MSCVRCWLIELPKADVDIKRTVHQWTAIRAMTPRNWAQQPDYFTPTPDRPDFSFSSTAFTLNLRLVPIHQRIHPQATVKPDAGAANMAELTTTKLNAESHLLLVRLCPPS